MKKLIFITAILISCANYAQKNIAKKIIELQNQNTNFKTVSVLSPIHNGTVLEIDKVVDGATLATLDIAKVNEVANNYYATIELQIPYNNQVISVLLYSANLFAEGFHVDTDKATNTPYKKGVYYRGIIKGDTNSVSSFNFFEGEFNGIISCSAFGNLVIGKLEKPNNKSDYIIYSDAKMKVVNPFECHTQDEGIAQVSHRNRNVEQNTEKCVSFYFEVDNNLYLTNGSNTTTTTNWMTGVYNNIQTLFLNDGIRTSLKSIFIWTSLDPYQGIGTTSSPYLTTFRSTRTVFDGDVAHLVGIDPGGLGGVAYLNSVCTTFNYAYSDVNFAYSTIPTYSWTINVMTHEFGHSLGSPHTHRCAWFGTNQSIDGCGTQAGYPEGTCPIGPIPDAVTKGTIMSYCHLIAGVGVSFANGFGPLPAELLLNTVDNKPCIGASCVNNCSNTVTSISTNNITATAALISWVSLTPSASWQVSVTPFSVNTPVWNTVTTNSYLVTGLVANTYYRIRVRPLCIGIEPISRENVFATNSINFCNNVIFTDTGGATGNYRNNESWIRTITPSNAGLQLRATFTNFNLESNFDFLNIYDGTNELDPNLTPGGLTGTVNPGVFNSTAADGSLSFSFTSNQTTVSSGWTATITCTGTLGITDNDYIDFLYYPNPSNGRVTMSCNTQITNVKVYNIEGRLLFEQKKNELSTSVDISQFATGTYFFKVKIGDFEKNFKILKL